jgi:hypothetical protein
MDWPSKSVGNIFMSDRYVRARGGRCRQALRDHIDTVFFTVSTPVDQLLRLLTQRCQNFLS